MDVDCSDTAMFANSELLSMLQFKKSRQIPWTIITSPMKLILFALPHNRIVCIALKLNPFDRSVHFHVS